MTNAVVGVVPVAQSRAGTLRLSLPSTGTAARLRARLAPL
jgi:hypothetical protein